MKTVDIVFPVYYGNYTEIELSINQVLDFSLKNMNEYDWRLILAINGPFPEKIIDLVENKINNYRVSYVYTPSPGKGAGIKHAWMKSSADLLAYMDIDLSVDLSSLPNLIENLSIVDVVVGSKYHKDSIVQRRFLRNFVSIIYHKFFQNIFMGVKCKDAHCGFKSIRNEVAELILPHVQDTGWYFDSELIYLIEKLNYSIKEIPVKWEEHSSQSGVNLKKVIPGFILKTLEIKLRSLPLYARKK